MAIGAFNPRGPNATNTRPARQNTDVNLRQWYQDCTTPSAKDGTTLSAQDFNFMLAQYRVAMDHYGVADVEADDEILKKLLQAVEAGFAFELVRGRHIDSYSGAGIACGQSETELVRVSSIPTETTYQRRIDFWASGYIVSGVTLGEAVYARLQGQNGGGGWVTLCDPCGGFGNFAGIASEQDWDTAGGTWFDAGDAYDEYRVAGIATGDSTWTILDAMIMVEEVG